MKRSLWRSAISTRIRKPRLRRPTRSPIRGHREPDLYPQIVSALRRTIKIHRRLMKVAPQMFDYGIRAKMEQEDEKHAKFMREAEAALRKVYDCDETEMAAPTTVVEHSSAIAHRPSAMSVPAGITADEWTRLKNEVRRKQEIEAAVKLYNSLSPAKRRRVEELYAEWELWMTIARNLRLQAEKQVRPRLPSWNTLCNMLEVAFTLGRLATGLETNYKPDPHQHLFHRDPYADLERIYGSASQ